MKNLVRCAVACLMLLPLPIFAQLQNAPTVVLLNAAAVTGPATPYRGGVSQVSCTGTFASATVTIDELAADGVTFVSTGVTFTAAGFAALTVPNGTLEAVVSGATGTPSLTCTVSSVPVW
jgi:hypothetical protein